LKVDPLLEQLFRVHKRICILFQNPDDQFFNPTVFDEVAFALKEFNFDRSELENRIGMMASKLGLLDPLDREPYSLSFEEKETSITSFYPSLRFGCIEDISYDENLLFSIGLASSIVVRIAEDLGDGCIQILDELLSGSELDCAIWKRLNLGG